MSPWPGGLPEGCRLAVFDLDGTLYEQGPVRRRMMLRLLGAGGQPGRLTRLAILRRYRALREEGVAAGPEGGIEDALHARLARETGRDPDALRVLTRAWMEEHPLAYLAAARVPGAADLFGILRRRGVRVAVWSDYPVLSKLAALGLEADDHAAADDPDVRALKPDPAGLRRLIARAAVAPAETLMIGDRPERDGEAARRAGVPFLLRARRGPEGVPRVADFVGLAEALA